MLYKFLAKEESADNIVQIHREKINVLDKAAGKRAV